MSDGITVRILGDYGPFPRMGKSIGYQIIIGQSSYLIDCGAPLFQQIGGHGLKEVRGLIITHTAMTTINAGLRISRFLTGTRPTSLTGCAFLRPKI